MLIEIDAIQFYGKREIDKGGTLYNRLEGADGISSYDWRLRYADPVYRAKSVERMRKMTSTQDWHKMNAEHLRILNSNPIHLAGAKMRAQKRNAAPGWPAALRAGIEKRKANPVWRAAVKLHLQKLNSSPEQSENRRRNAVDPALRAAASTKAKVQWANPAFRAAALAGLARGHITQSKGG